MREAVVSGLEPFIDTIVVCTVTALVILSTGIWNRDAALELPEAPAVAAAGHVWQLADSPLPADLRAGSQFFTIVTAHPNKQSKTTLHRVPGTAEPDEAGQLRIRWAPFEVRSNRCQPGLLSLKGATPIMAALTRRPVQVLAGQARNPDVAIWTMISGAGTASRARSSSANAG